jgi:hypothetical protein
LPTAFGSRRPPWSASGDRPRGSHCRSQSSGDGGASQVAAIRRGASRDQAYAVRQRIEHDTHRDTLRQPDPGKGRIDVGEQVRAGAALAILDAAGDALDMAGQIGGLADQADGRPVIDADARQLVLDPPDVWQQLLISHGARLSRSAVLRLR